MLQPYLARTIHSRGYISRFYCFCFLFCFPHSLINSYEQFASLIPNPTLIAALGAIPPPALLSSVPLTQNQLSASSTYNLLQSSYGSGLILSPAEAPVPQKIVDKIRSGQFVEMRELLADNISLLEQLHSIHAPGNISAAGPSRPRMRDVFTLPSWLYCFLTYTTTDQPTKDKLAYARLMILKASRHGHLGWLDYDRSFRQQAAANPSLPWNTLSPALHATTILGNFTGKPSRLLCSLCRRVDHTRNECATFTRNPIHLHQRLRIQSVTCVTRGIEVPASIPAHARTTMFVLHALVQHLILLAN